MIAASQTDLPGVALVIVACGTFVTTVLNAWQSRRTYHEVKSGNELKSGELASANETRRVEDIPHDERTAQEQRHVDTAPETGPAQGPGR